MANLSRQFRLFENLRSNLHLLGGCSVVKNFGRGPVTEIVRVIRGRVIMSDTNQGVEFSTIDKLEGKTEEGEDVARKPTPFIRRKKMVLMLSYCGQGYFGMQKNPGTKTIEEDLLAALLKAGYIDEDSYKAPRVMQFQRAARTDKSVSAARQIVSMKMPDNVEIDKINEFLPAQIRIMGAKKVTKGFDAKQSCDARTYMYMIPTFAFTPIEENVTEDYRITPGVLEELRETLKMYLGTKNFHNFTSKRKSTDPSSKRYIISFTSSDPFVKDGLEYVILRIKGQSFMLHQIRKMIGLVVAFMRGFAGKDTFTKSWTLERIDIPKAPGVGLVLDHVHYERYNARYGEDGMHEKLTWDKEHDQVEEFCQNFIYPVITKCENEEKSMFEWLNYLPYHTYDERQQLRPSVVKDDDDDDAPSYNPNPKILSKIGDAAALVNREILKKLDDEDATEDDDDDERKAKRKIKPKTEDDNDDEEIVRSELAKRRRSMV